MRPDEPTRGRRTSSDSHKHDGRPTNERRTSSSGSNGSSNFTRATTLRLRTNKTSFYHWNGEKIKEEVVRGRGKLSNISLTVLVRHASDS
mmetsp:Transcript_49795/g.50622  ORF Transcript_49795/g.50622 Transcript_49795/m.50622 type:complete len:90 (+) Transcript_49795:310-579(+)